MDVEKTVQFILEQQAVFVGHISELREQQANSAQQIEALGQAVRDLLQVATLQSGRLDAHDRRLEAQEKRSEAFEQRFDQFLERFDAFLRGKGRDGR